ncbi:MAG: ArsA family ATPase [Candidatus Schekmanbacteria bacterium]|nr:ArsA family ATPase [Candidatus Schekmanbacteria bacterium]
MSRIDRLPLPEIDRPLIFVGGKGGVGKTTVAAAIALLFARRDPEKRVLLLSTDPAHSVSDALAAGPHAGPALPPNLLVEELDSASLFAAFRARHREGIRQIALRGTFLDDEDLAGFIDLGMPGLDELAALQAIAERSARGDLARLIVDTAPTGHTLRLLELPDVLDRWRDALDALMEKHRVMARMFRGRRVADEADALLSELEELLAAIRKLFRDDRKVAFLPVMVPDPLALWETRRLLCSLAGIGIFVPLVILNRVIPGTPACSWCHERQQRDLVWAEKAAVELRAALVGRPLPLLTVPLQAVEPRGLHELSAMASVLSGDARGQAPDSAPQRPPSLPPEAGEGEVGGPRNAPPKLLARALDEARLVLVCGKGGVGKTTIAAALALVLPRGAAGRAGQGRTLLFSTDPAHSISDALALPVGEQPTEVYPGLDAVEVDAAARFQTFRKLYADEVHGFFTSLFSADGLDASVDRVAMEHLIDLSPPGLDEIMALTDLVDHLRANTYRRIVVDTAPTGHFLRLLELPELIRDWSRGFFELFLKYRQVFRVPKVKEFLVSLSRGIRELQKTLTDPAACVVLPVAIPTQLSFAETERLCARLRTAGLAVRGGVLNHYRASAEPGCDLCAAAVSRSAAFRKAYQSVLPAGAVWHGVEECLEPPVGVDALTRIGEIILAREITQ